VRLRTALVASVSAAAAGAALVACVDLLHSTSDLETACQLDGQTPGCTNEAGVAEASPSGTDFCQWSSAQARSNATHACAWLSACEGPLGNNAFGACMFHALLAYNCAANPSHPVRGTTRDQWDCLWQVKSCGDVTACVFPKGTEDCDDDGSACAAHGGPAPNNLDVRVSCVAGSKATGENCALWGQTCGFYVEGGVGGVCGAAGCALDPGSTYKSECDGTLLHSCAGALDVGVDCADNGAGQCGGFASDSWAACLPSAPGAACTASLAATCASGVAKSCPTGHQETVDCLELLQDVRACNAGTLSPSFDWTSACAVMPLADAGAPCAESCAGTSVVACYRGGTFPLDCADAGLGACQMVTTDAVHAVCAAP
jgi:hypothetical protein